MGLRKAFKKITKGLRKAIKSKVGKLILAGTALYLTGIVGKAGGGASAGSAATQAAGSTAAKEALTAAGGEAIKSGAGEGYLNKAISGIGGFVEKNPMASAMIFNAASSALSPDETELMQEQENIRQQKYKNMQVPGGIGLTPSNQPLRDANGQPVYRSKGILNQGMTL